MKNILFFISLFMFSCKLSKYDDNLNVDFHIPSEKNNHKFTKIYIINKGKNMILLTDVERSFLITKWSKGRRNGDIGIVHLDFSKRRKIPIITNDSTTIYVDNSPTVDTLYFELFWKRDSLGLDEIKLYNDKKGNLKYHSSKKIARGTLLNSNYEIFNYCPIIDDSISRKLTQ